MFKATIWGAQADKMTSGEERAQDRLRGGCES